MDYKIVLTIDAESQLDAFIRYLLFEKKNEQAAMKLLNDFESCSLSPICRAHFPVIQLNISLLYVMVCRLIILQRN